MDRNQPRKTKTLSYCSSFVITQGTAEKNNNNSTETKSVRVIGKVSSIGTSNIFEKWFIKSIGSSVVCDCSSDSCQSLSTAIETDVPNVIRFQYAKTICEFGAGGKKGERKQDEGRNTPLSLIESKILLRTKLQRFKWMNARQKWKKKAANGRRQRNEKFTHSKAGAIYALRVINEPWNMSTFLISYSFRVCAGLRAAIKWTDPIFFIIIVRFLFGSAQSTSPPSDHNFASIERFRWESLAWDGRWINDRPCIWPCTTSFIAFVFIVCSAVNEGTVDTKFESNSPWVSVQPNLILGAFQLFADGFFVCALANRTTFSAITHQPIVYSMAAVEDNCHCRD